MDGNSSCFSVPCASSDCSLVGYSNLMRKTSSLKFTSAVYCLKRWLYPGQFQTPFITHLVGWIFAEGSRHKSTSPRCIRHGLLIYVWTPVRYINAQALFEWLSSLLDARKSYCSHCIRVTRASDSIGASGTSCSEQSRRFMNILKL